MKTARVRAGAFGLALAVLTIPALADGIYFVGTVDNGVAAIEQPRQKCVGRLTDAEIVASVARQGYDDIELDPAGKRRVLAFATQGEWLYELRVSTCTGNVLVRDPISHS